MLPASIIQLKIKHRHITLHIPSQIRNLLRADAQKNYLIQQHKWNNEIYNDIDWELLSSTITTFSIKKRWFIIKWINHLPPFNERHYIFNMTSDPYCLSKCNGKENEKHSLRCNNQDQTKILEKLEKDLIIILKKYKVNPDIRRVIEV